MLAFSAIDIFYVVWMGCEVGFGPGTTEGSDADNIIGGLVDAVVIVKVKVTGFEFAKLTDGRSEA